MAQKAYKEIEAYLHEVAEHYKAIEIPVEVGRQLLNQGLSLLDVREILESGQVIWADRDEFGSPFIVSGRTTDEREVTIEGRLEQGRYEIRLDSVTA